MALVCLTFLNISLEKLAKVASDVQIVAEQPKCEVYSSLKGRKPEFYYRVISVSRKGDDAVIYHISDKGRITGVAEEVTIGDRTYTEEEVDTLKQ